MSESDTTNEEQFNIQRSMLQPRPRKTTSPSASQSAPSWLQSHRLTSEEIPWAGHIPRRAMLDDDAARGRAEPADAGLFDVPGAVARPPGADAHTMTSSKLKFETSVKFLCTEW